RMPGPLDRPESALRLPPPPIFKSLLQCDGAAGGADSASAHAQAVKSRALHDFRADSLQGRRRVQRMLFPRRPPPHLRAPRNREHSMGSDRHDEKPVSMTPLE